MYIVTAAHIVSYIFHDNFYLESINRIPAITSANGNSITIFDGKPPSVLNPPTAGSVMSFKNDKNIQRSAIQRTLIGLPAVDKIIQNKTYALQTLSLYLNNALIELTNALGSDIVTDMNNELVISFQARNEYGAVEMTVALLLN